MRSEDLYNIQALSNELKAFTDNIISNTQQIMPIMEMNALSQICLNNNLSEEVRSIASARVEEIVKQIYSKQQNNEFASQFK